MKTIAFAAFLIVLIITFVIMFFTVESTPGLSHDQAISIARQFDKMKPSPEKTKALEALRKHRGITF